MADRPGAVTFHGNPLTLTGSPVAVGQKAPEFVALRGDLSGFALSNEAGKVVVINSVPSLDTPVCALQARRFNQEAAALGAGVKVLVVSMDLPFAQKRFCTTEGIANLETVSDHRDAAFGEAYGLLVKELRLNARAVIVVGRDGIVRYQQVVGEITHEPDYAAALATVRSLL
ncbi:MAG TPA: thiol peroxidase [Thermoanaerobaculaceae bacterium]|nr:thiol peroxidase [Acidobacteriota bacterium]NLH11797.1 thiol peroxidase [Holophagae bacterium]HPW56341.1 thiol peroxidase [Thermoanaerobaculaceae bacterium]